MYPTLCRMHIIPFSIPYIFSHYYTTIYTINPGGVRTLIALHCGSNIFNMAAKAEEVGWF